MKKGHTIKSLAVPGLIILCLIIGTSCSFKPTSDENNFKLLEASGVQNNFKVGDSFKVVLKGNPSTGYGWYYTFDNTDIIELSSENDVQDRKNVAGSESTFTWNFKALKTGQVKITYKYYRSWEGEVSATKKDTVEYLITVETSSQISTDTSSEIGSPIASSDEAIQIVKTFFGNENDKYIFEFDNEDKILKDENGDFYINRNNESSENGLDCYIIRVYTETKDGDSISQDNIGWYFVSKNNSKIFEMTDPYETKLKAMN